MTKKEFLERLKEDKWFEDPQELIDYRFPVLQYWLSNYSNRPMLLNNGDIITSNNVTITHSDENFTSVNKIFERIKEMFKDKLL